MFDRHERSALLQSRWLVAVVAILLLVLLLAAVSHSPMVVCCLVLVPLFLFSLVELPSYRAQEEHENENVVRDVSPSLFQRPPPSLT